MKNNILVCVSLLAGLLAACGSRYTTQEAYEICTSLTDRNPATNPPEAFDDCVACYENCGEECKQLGTAPEQYACPDDLDEGAGGS